MRIAPYLDGHGPVIELQPGDSGEITIADATPGAWPGAAPVPPVCTVVFRWDRYRAGIGARTDAERANDILSFCLAYVERPSEFDREPDDTEQEHAAFWRAYGEAFQCDTEPSEYE